jgi:hypothetical protein
VVNKLTLQDSWLSSSISPSYHSYLSIQPGRNYIKSHTNTSCTYGSLLVIGLYLSDTIVTYQRDVPTLVTALSMTGGLMGLITGTAAAIALIVNR